MAIEKIKIFNSKVQSQLNNHFSKTGLKSLFPTNIYLLAYITIFMVLWDTKGMTNPHDHSFPFASVFLSVTFLVLFAVSFIKKSNIEGPHVNMLGLVLLAEFIFFLIGNFSHHHSIFTYTTKISYLFIFNIIFYASFGLLILSYLLKKYQELLLKLLLLFAMVFSVTVIICSVETGIDTHLFLNMASDYFTNFNNPYQYTYPDIYNGEFTEVYGNKYYFNYWPMALYLCSIFRFLFGDVRYAFVLAQFIFVYLLIRNRHQLSLTKVLLISLIWLMNLVVLYVNERSWIDALVVPFFMSSLLLIRKKQFFWASILIGLMASIKLYYVFALPIFGLYYLRERKIKEIFLMGLAFVSTFVPFAIISFNSLYSSTIVFINSTKIREDSLSVISAIKRILGIDASFTGMMIMFAFLGLFAIMFLRSKNNILNIAKYVNLSFFAIFLLSKQSFCNYFYFNMVCSFIIFYLESNYGKDDLPEKNKSL